MLVQIKTMMGKLVPIEIDMYNDTAQVLYDAAEKHTHAHPDALRIIHLGKHVDKSVFLHTLHVTEHATFFVVVSAIK